MKFYIIEDNFAEYEILKNFLTDKFDNIEIYPSNEEEHTELRDYSRNLFMGAQMVNDAHRFFKKLKISETDFFLIDYFLFDEYRGCNGLSMYENLKLTSKAIIITHAEGVDFTDIGEKILNNRKFKNIIAIQKGNINNLSENQIDYYLEKLEEHFSLIPSNQENEPKNLNKSIKLFISYCTKDNTLKEEFKNFCVNLIDEKLIDFFNDVDIELGENPNEVIQQNLNHCDFMVALVNDSYLSSNYIKQFEIEKAKELGKKIIPIIIGACDWKNHKVIKNFQAPLKGENISFNLTYKRENTDIERKEKWNEVIKEFREKLLK